MASTRKVPLRKCVGCGEMKPKKELIRVVRCEDGNFVLDATGKKNGRGAYICNSGDCLGKAVKAKDWSVLSNRRSRRKYTNVWKRR